MKNILSITILLSLLSLSVACQSAQDRPQRPSPRPQFSEVDTNGNNLIEWEEFATQTIPHGTLEELFNKIDTDEDGIISKQEFEAHKPSREREK